MGDPRYPRRQWRKPKRPLNYDLKMEELRTLGSFGLRTKRELWKARTELSRVRQQARALLALGKEARGERESVLIRSLARVGLVGADAGLDDVLNLQIKEVLSRRLQSIVMAKMDFVTPYQARQAVTHGHIMVGDRIVDIPSYTVSVSEEDGVRLVPGSPLEKVLEENRRRAEEAEKRRAAEEADEAAPGSAEEGSAHGMVRADTVGRPSAADVGAAQARAAGGQGSSPAPGASDPAASGARGSA